MPLVADWLNLKKDENLFKESLLPVTIRSLLFKLIQVGPFVTLIFKDERLRGKKSECIDVSAGIILDESVFFKIFSI